MNINIDLKRERNWNNTTMNNNLKHESKRFKKNMKKRVTYKNKNNVRNLNMSPNAILSRQKVGVSTNRENLPNFMRYKNVAHKKYINANTYRKKILNKMSINK
jgi:hypothetical protein